VERDVGVGLGVRRQEEHIVVVGEAGLDTSARGEGEQRRRCGGGVSVGVRVLRGDERVEMERESKYKQWDGFMFHSIV